VVTYADGKGGRDVGVPWVRAPHVGPYRWVLRLPWITLAIAVVALLVDAVAFGRMARRSASDAAKAPSDAPAPFRRADVLDALVTAAVGLSLASLVAGCGAAPSLPAALAAASLAMAWAWLLRRPGRARIGTLSIHRGWLWLAPLAAIYGAVLWFASRSGGERLPPLDGVLPGVFLLGVFLALALLGVCIAWSHARREQGRPGGEERGDRAASFAAVVASVVGLALQDGRIGADSQPLPGTLLVRALALIGLLAGATAVVVVQVRMRSRRLFVARVEAGEVPGYRVTTRDGDRVLVRSAADANAYRAGVDEFFL
jgi:hypothetical protein